MELQPYGVMIAAGLIVSGITGKRMARLFCVNFYDVLLLFAYALAFGMCGAKLTYLLLNMDKIPWSSLDAASLLALLGSGGFVFYGGLFFGAGGILLAKRLHRLDLPTCLRICVPLLPLAHSFGRIGCFLAGCCHGIEYHGVMSVTYQSSTAAPNGVALFPVQLLEAVVLLLLACLLFWMLFRGVRLGGMVMVYILCYASCRFLLEFLRGDLVRGKFFGLSTSQWLSILLLSSIPAFLTLYCVRKKRK